jgi:hypothetical protein
MSGHSERISLARRAIGDFLHVAKKMPIVGVERRIAIAAVLAARNAAQPRPGWTGIFTKAYAKVVAARPWLRKSYLGFPWERFYLTDKTSADVVVEAQQDGEDIVFPARIRDPLATSLADIDRILIESRERPMGISRFRESMRIARFPRMIRRVLWSLALNVSGRLRTKYLANFGVTSVSRVGSEALYAIGPWTSLLTFGVVNADGEVVMRLLFDHRVMDGTEPARALVDLERVLNTDIVAELHGLARGQAQAA